MASIPRDPAGNANWFVPHFHEFSKKVEAKNILTQRQQERWDTYTNCKSNRCGVQSSGMADELAPGWRGKI